MGSENQSSEKEIVKDKRSGKDRRVFDDTIFVGTDRRKQEDRRKENLNDEGPNDIGSTEAQK